MKCLVRNIKFGESLIGNEQQTVLFKRGFAHFINTITGEPVFLHVEVLETVVFLMIQIKSATGGGKPQTASAVLHNAVYIVVAETTGYFRVVTIVG